MRKARDVNYWLRILLVIVLGMAVGRWLSGFDWWRSITYRTYGVLLRASQSPPKYPSWTAIVLIDDDDYWLGQEWARRTPLKRATLARLIERIQSASPQVIALDVDLRAQRPDGRFLTHADYEQETRTLFDEIAAVAPRIPIVLPRSIGFDEASKRFVIDADLFDKLQLGPHVASGYTRVPADLRNLAMPTSVDGRRLDSLAAAAANFVEPRALQVARSRGGHELPFSMFLAPEAYAGYTFPAREVLAGNPAALEKMRGKVVLVGGAWHREAYRRGELVDHHLTPVGDLPGAMVHANYIEALLAQRTFSPTYHWVHYVLDVMVGLALAAVFIAARGGWKVIYLLALSVIVAVLSLVAFQNLGTFLDAVPTLVLLGAHAAYETIVEWKDAYDEHELCIASLTASGLRHE